jgi:hypothetical protein
MSRRDFVGGYHTDTAVHLEDLLFRADCTAARHGADSPEATAALNAYLTALTKVAEARRDPRDSFDRAGRKATRRRRNRQSSRPKLVRRNVSRAAA